MDVNSKIIPFELHPTGFIEEFSRLGASLEALLNNTGIPRSYVGRRGYKISYQQQKQLLKNGLRLCRTPGLGLLIGTRMDWGYHGTVGAVLSCSPSLKNAGAALCRFLPIAQPHYAQLASQPSLYVDKDGMIVNPLRTLARDSEEQEIMLFETEYRLSMTLRLYDQCGNKNVGNSEVRVQLAYPAPAHAHLYRSLPCTEIAFDAQQTAIVCHHQFLVVPWRKLRSATYARIIEQCEQELSHVTPSDLTAKVRWHISLYYNQPVSLEQIADQLALSPRSLTRRLASEGTNFRRIVHQLRMELTALHLRSSSLSVDEVAELMGFSGPSSLRRAIKNWSGETAGTLRNCRPASPSPSPAARAPQLLPL